MYGADPKRVGIGDHILVSRARGVASGATSVDSAEQWLRTNGPFLLEAVGGDTKQFPQTLDTKPLRILEACDPRPAPALWTSTFDFSRDEFFGRVNYIGGRVHDGDHELLGYRLEITALGDEVNEAARIEQSAQGGQVLTSKPLLERLAEDDASALGLDPAKVAYRALADTEGVTEKAKRDAGALAVANIAVRMQT